MTNDELPWLSAWELGRQIRGRLPWETAIREIAGQLDAIRRRDGPHAIAVVSLPHGWGHGGSGTRRIASKQPGVDPNALIDQRAMEPLSGMTILNGFPVSVERLEG